MQFLHTLPSGEEQLRGHPGWRIGDTAEEARLLTAEELVDQDFGLLVIDNPPEFDPETQRRVLAPMDEWPRTETTATKAYVVSDLSVEELRANKLAALADKRWQVEIGGITLNGMPIKTDRDSAAKLTSAYLKATVDPDNFAIANWKVAEGVFVTLDAATIIAIGDAVTAHVQACFDREAELSADIAAAGTAAELVAIDIDTGWPS